MITLTRRRLLAGAAALTALSGQSRPTPGIATWPLLDAPPATHRTSRLDVTLDGRGYRLFRALPSGPVPAGGWPSIWMLDGNAAFNRLTADQLSRQPGLAVIALGHQVETEIAAEDRTLDYTPAPLNGAVEPRARGRATGGDDAFRDRLAGPLMQAAADGAMLNPARRSLWGHSFGGLFTLSTLFRRPDLFRGYVPVSPSTGFGGGALARIEAAAVPLADGRAEVLVMLGDQEHRRSTDAPVAPRPSPQTLALAKRLEARPDLKLRVSVLEGLTHGATFRASLGPALAWAAAVGGLANPVREPAGEGRAAGE
ncbi:alpha/beta hydrolase [Paracoccus siganidrum]|uniref:Acyl-CoA:diacylglycerol acyltransferase n=1 Tax=Paracoccus siganidrum TaxID=1276757 RepID=A0A419A7Z1_9RHOB|nr:alpha/beta hydrolase-fold protein [Paracoccus siganidrum]RJL16605.1 alpha/beta hydrolase [Paracoccus siganidrum]RMC34559.1 alpha/beta hydrolase [Paracoccus siganidrum]